MHILFNKQREIVIASFIAIALLGAVGIFAVRYIAQEREEYKQRLAREQEQRIALWQPATPKAQLPVATFIPVRKEDSRDLVLPNAHAAVIIDVASRNVLFRKNATDRRGVASTTKLLTAMIVIDRMQNLDEYVTVPREVLFIEGTKVGCLTSVICESNRLEEGEQLRVRDLLYAMLMDSANDAATLLAIHVAGSEEGFAKLMNLRAEELGLHDSNFCRPSGLEVDPPRQEDECYSSAYDIARVMAHLADADRYSVLWDIMQTPERTIVSKDGTIKHELKNTNRLLGEVSYVRGAKTGFTPRAGFSLALMSQKPGADHEVVAVVLDDLKRFPDVQEMSEWAFESYEWQ